MIFVMRLILAEGTSSVNICLLLKYHPLTSLADPKAIS